MPWQAGPGAGRPVRGSMLVCWLGIGLRGCYLVFPACRRWANALGCNSSPVLVWQARGSCPRLALFVTWASFATSTCVSGPTVVHLRFHFCSGRPLPLSSIVRLKARRGRSVAAAAREILGSGPARPLCDAARLVQSWVALEVARFQSLQRSFSSEYRTRGAAKSTSFWQQAR